MKLPEHKPFALGILLGGMAFIGMALVSLVFYLGKEKIADNQRLAVLHNLQQVLPPELYDNDIVNDTLEVMDSRLGNHGATTIYRARKNNQPVAVIIASAAPDGYSGQIALLVAIKKEGILAGVRVTAHQETPGLGDKIDVERSDWPLKFNHQSLQNLPLAQWTVKRDGGHFDQFSGATVTPRAVVKAVKNTLLYYKVHQVELF